MDIYRIQLVIDENRWYSGIVVKAFQVRSRYWRLRVRTLQSALKKQTFWDSLFDFFNFFCRCPSYGHYYG